MEGRRQLLNCRAIETSTRVGLRHSNTDLRNQVLERAFALLDEQRRTAVSRAVLAEVDRIEADIRRTGNRTERGEIPGP